VEGINIIPLYLPKFLVDQIFCILTLLLKNIYVWTPRNFICKFGPDARRHSLWRRGNTARRHILWRRGMTWQQRLPVIDVAATRPRSSAPQILAPSYGRL
jgi:hypothetical protein